MGAARQTLHTILLGSSAIKGLFSTYEKREDSSWYVLFFFCLYPCTSLGLQPQAGKQSCRYPRLELSTLLVLRGSGFDLTKHLCQEHYLPELQTHSLRNSLVTPNAENEECFIVVRAVKPNMIKQIPKHEGTQKMEHFFLVHSYSLSKTNHFSRKGDGGGKNLTVVGGGLKSFT